MAFDIHAFGMNIVNTIMATVKPKIESKVDSTRVLTDVPANAVFTDTVYTNEMAQDAVNTMFQNGTHSNITVTYDDAGNAISLAGSASSTNLTDEQVQDIVGGGIFGGYGVSVVYDDDANKITVSLSGEQLTATLLTKLNGIAEGAEVNVNPDWNATSGKAQILNKPAVTELTNTTDLTQSEVNTAWDNA